MSYDVRRCHECGQPLGAKDLFCPRCGAKQPRDPKQVAERSGMPCVRPGFSISAINE